MSNFKYKNPPPKHPPINPLQPPQAKAEPPARLGDIRFRQLMRPKDWAALPAAVKRRFGHRVKGAQSQIYRGYVTQTQMNLAGRLFAQTLRLIGAPLPIDHANEGQAAVVTVTEDHAGCGQFWSRQYGRRTGFPQVIHSSKRFAGPTGLEEYIGHGIGMTLTLAVEDETLLFQSAQYFVTLMGRRIYLPKWLCPGDLTVSHADHGDCWGAAWFEFGLKLTHPLLGTLINQRVMFEDFGE